MKNDTIFLESFFHANASKWKESRIATSEIWIRQSTWIISCL